MPQKGSIASCGEHPICQSAPENKSGLDPLAGACTGQDDCSSCHNGCLPLLGGSWVAFGGGVKELHVTGGLY